MTQFDFLSFSENEVLIKNLFNEEHAESIIKQLRNRDLSDVKLILWNVGVKIMKEIFESLQDNNIYELCIHYDWDEIMLNPKLVSWDKMSWKTLQQLANWNKVWAETLAPLYQLRKLRMQMRCSWFNQGFLQSVIGSIQNLSNLNETVIVIESKDTGVGKYLQNNQKQNRLANFSYAVQEWKK